MADKQLAKLVIDIEARLGKVESQLDSIEKKSIATAKKMESTFKSAQDTINKIGVATGIAFGTQQIGQFIMQSAELAGKLQGVKKAFDLIATPDLLKNLRAATKGTVADLQLMQTAVRANNFEIPLEQLASLLEFARRRARATGDDVNYLVDSIILGIGRKSPLVLDNLGISAVRLRQKLGGISDETATVGDVAQAVGSIVSEELKKMGDDADTAADKTGRVAARFENIKTQVGAGLLGTLDEMAERIDNIAQAGEGQGITNLIDFFTKASMFVPRKITLPALEWISDVAASTFEKDAVLNPGGGKSSNTLQATTNELKKQRNEISGIMDKSRQVNQVFVLQKATAGQIKDRITEISKQMDGLSPKSAKYKQLDAEQENLKKLIGEGKKHSDSAREIAAIKEKFYNTLKNLSVDYYKYSVDRINAEAEEFRKAGIKQVDIAIYVQQRMKALKKEMYGDFDFLGFQYNDMVSALSQGSIRKALGDTGIKKDMSMNYVEQPEKPVYFDSQALQQQWEDENRILTDAISSTTSIIQSEFSGMWDNVIGGANSAFEIIAGMMLEKLAMRGLTALLNWILPGTGAGAVAAKAAGGHLGGYFVNTAGRLTKAPSFSSGTYGFTVPRGFSNDSFPLMVESGERVQVTSSNKTRSQESEANLQSRYLRQLLGRIDVLNHNVIGSSVSPGKQQIEIVGRSDGEDMYWSQDRVEKRLSRSR
jgi:hypothetical protein